MIIIGLGANLPSDLHGPPVSTLRAAVASLDAARVFVRRRSRWYRTAPVPAAPDQPWYVNGVAVVDTALSPAALLALLHRIEAALGRIRSAPNAARVIDLDLLAYDDRVSRGDMPGEPVLPHPRLAGRAFVLLPLAEVAPDWRHPVTGAAVADLIAALPPDQVAEPMTDP